MGVSGCGTGSAVDLDRCSTGYSYPAFACKQLCRFALCCAVLCYVVLLGHDQPEVSQWT